MWSGLIIGYYSRLTSKDCLERDEKQLGEVVSQS